MVRVATVGRVVAYVTVRLAVIAEFVIDVNFTVSTSSAIAGFASVNEKVAVPFASVVTEAYVLFRT